MVYLDTSFIASYFLSETNSAAVQRFFREASPQTLAISHWTGVEFSSLLATRCRMGLLTDEARQMVEEQFERVCQQSFLLLPLEIADFLLARRFLGRYATGLRGGDALHLAIASNHNAEALHTLDKKLMKAGAMLGLSVSAGIS